MEQMLILLSRDANAFLKDLELIADACAAAQEK